jgi:hypothetical protein
MPVIVAVAIRYIIMAAVQLGLWSLLEKGIGLFNQGVVAIMTYFGVDEETAKDIMANKILVAFEEVGVFAATLKTKLPIKVAEYFGFTSKGYAKRKILSAAAARAESTAILATSKAAATAVEVEKIAEVVSASRGINGATVKTFLNYIFKYAGLTTGIFFAAAQYIDFANWQGPYQGYFQKVLSAFGINPDTVMPKAGTVSPDIWKRIYSVIEELHPVGIAYPFSDQDRPYSRENLARLIDEIAANIIKSGGDATFKKVMAIAMPLIQLSGQAPTPSSNNVSSSSSSSYSAAVLAEQRALNKLGAGLVEDGILGPKTLAARAKYASVTGSVTTTKPATAPAQVVSGVLSQGTIGTVVDFQSRPDDLIESATELQDAMHNNVAPFLATLPNRVSYEVKIVSSVKTADGFTQKGSVQRIISGYTTKGVPKYKNVVNKFAVVDLKIKNATGSFTKLATLVLGPVDSVKFTGANIDLSGLAVAVQQNIVAPTSIISAPVSTPTSYVSKEAKDITIQDIVALGYTINQAYRLIGGPNHNNGANYVRYYGSIQDAAKSFGFIPNTTTPPEPITMEYVMSLGYPEEEAGYIVGGNDPTVDPNSPLYGTTKRKEEDISVPTPATGQTTQMSNDERYEVIYNPATNVWSVDDHQLNSTKTYSSRAAAFAAAGQADPGGGTPTQQYSTLYEYYTAKGQAMPSVSSRAALYQQLGLGQSAYYTGTAEQNTKLLKALQAQ